MITVKCEKSFDTIEDTDNIYYIGMFLTLWLYN